MARKTPLGIEKRFDRFGEWIGDTWIWRKAAPLFSRHPSAETVMTWLMRTGVGATFVVSGLSKGIDPWGTFYKMTEYLQALHLPIQEWGNTVLAVTFFLFTLEFLIGVSLLTGCFRKAAPIMGSLVMMVMLPLTLWIAIADPVEDCGCFGDLFVISNWATFVKNIFLSVGFLWLLKFNKSARCIVSPYLQWMMAVGSAAYVMTVGYIGYRHQPLMDFRPYPSGSMLLSEEDDSEYEPSYTFIYEKNGKTVEIGEDSPIPDEAQGWKFVRRIEQPYQKAKTSVKGNPSGDFRIWSEDGKEDLTSDLASESRQLILLIPDINGLSMDAGWKINILRDIAQKSNVEFFAVAAGSPSQIERWRDLSSGQYPIYTAEDTSIKELVRGNPALVETDEGKIIWKSALSGLSIDDSVSATILKEMESKGEKGHMTLAALTIILVSFLGALSLASALRLPYGPQS